MYKLKSWCKETFRTKTDILTLIGWIILLSLVIIKVHWITYTQTTRLSYYKIAFAIYEGPSLSNLDLLIIAFASFLAGFVLSDAKTMLYGYIISMFSVFVIGVIYVLFFIWFFFGRGELFQAISYGWELAVYMAIMEIFRMMFPLILGVCLLSLAVGSLVRYWMTS